MLTHVVGNFIMVCAQKQDRLLPASVVRQETEEKGRRNRTPAVWENFPQGKRQIQDDVYATLLSRAFTKNQQTYAFISVKDNLLVVDSASAPEPKKSSTCCGTAWTPSRWRCPRCALRPLRS